MSANVNNLISKSEACSRFSSDLLEQAPGGSLNNAVVEVLNSLTYLRMVVRAQQQQIEELRAALARLAPAAAPASAEPGQGGADVEQGAAANGTKP